MNKSFAIAAAAIAVAIAGAASASACEYNTGYTSYTPVQTYVVKTYTPSHDYNNTYYTGY